MKVKFSFEIDNGEETYKEFKADSVIDFKSRPEVEERFAKELEELLKLYVLSEKEVITNMKVVVL